MTRVSDPGTERAYVVARNDGYVVVEKGLDGQS